MLISYLCRQLCRGRLNWSKAATWASLVAIEHSGNGAPTWPGKRIERPSATESEMIDLSTERRVRTMKIVWSRQLYFRLQDTVI